MDNVKDDTVYEKKKAIFRTYQIVWYILDVIEVLLGLRVILKFLAANPASPFAALIYSLSYPFAYPFLTLFRSTIVGGSILEWSTITGMLIYLLISYGIVKILQIPKPVTKEEVTEKVDNPKVQI